MKVFRELTIRGQPTQLAAVLRHIDAHAKGDWRRDKAAERDVSDGAELLRMLCFRCTASSNRPSAALWMAYRDEFELFVPNVVPQEIQDLGHDGYNRVLEDFASRLALPACKDVGVELKLSTDQVDLNSWLSPEAAKRLKRFSLAANKNTGSAHPLDRDRWIEFLIAAHGESARLTPSNLHRWLVEEDHWPADAASDLASQYEFARDLLRKAHG